MKVLIIGAGGFAGSYLIDELCNNDFEVIATKLQNEPVNSGKCKIVDLEILFEQDIYNVINSNRPDVIFHLAAQSSVAVSWEKPALTANVNIKGVINLLEALRKLDYKPRVLLIGSGEEYGNVPENENPISEQTQANPANIYAVTKVCQNMIGKIYSDAYGLDIVMARAFNHFGPGQNETFVVSGFCKQAAEIEAGLKEPVIYTGNLNAKRDFTDVRDIVKAYICLARKGEKGEIYNVGSGKSIEISKILEIIIGASTAEIKSEVDKTKFRPIDVPIIEANIEKIKNKTGWIPEINIKTTIIDTLQYWRNKISLNTNENHYENH